MSSGHLFFLHFWWTRRNLCLGCLLWRCVPEPVTTFDRSQVPPQFSSRPPVRGHSGACLWTAPLCFSVRLCISISDFGSVRSPSVPICCYLIIGVVMRAIASLSCFAIINIIQGRMHYEFCPKFQGANP